MLKNDLHEILNSAVKAVLPENAVKDALNNPAFTSRKGKGKIVLASIGKAAWRMAKAASDILGPGVTGAVVTKYEHSMGEIKGLEIFEAGHPVPDENTIKGTEALLKHVRNLCADDTVLFLVSGGGSALFEMPAEGVTLDDMQDVTSQLLACGADIVEINTIRKHLSSVKGGRFAEMCAPAHVFMVVLSDVLGDRLDSIASGPAAPDMSTSDEALAVVKKYNLRVKPELLKILSRETPKKLDNVTATITGSVTALCQAVSVLAEKKGYTPLVLTTTLTCEAREAGSFLAAVAREVKASGRPVKAPCAIIAGGETVVHLTGKGLGGRNQELALSAATGIDGLDGIAVASLGSDGTDGPTDAAGGIVDG
ncbi:MAG: DUF4147 domain-containing protein, partial [Synergistaceae bacterium]|nr:DUF4147 domain-containing protein [Synergistaceae bacterium]